MKDIIYIKDAFPSLSLKKIVEINDLISKSKLVKLQIKMTTKEPSKKWVIISINKINTSVIINYTNSFIKNINNCLCESNLNTITDFVQLENYRVVTTTNQATSSQDMNIIEKCIKDSENINSEHIENPWLPKSKSYLKILGLSYLMENTNQPITSEIVEEAIKQIHIFNGVVLTLKPWIIKALSNSNLAVVWVNIWDSQNSSITKSIINWYFNIGRYITTIHSTNINPSVPQYKNC